MAIRSQPPEPPEFELDPLAIAIARELAQALGIRTDEPNGPLPTVPVRAPLPVWKITDTAVPGGTRDVPIRIYQPSQGQDLPILIYMHGGGWMSGDLDSVDANCRELSVRGRCLVVSVDYSLSPTHKFPTALEEIHAVSQWVADHASSVGGDETRIAIGGESSGANLAAAECLLARDRGGPGFVLQVLIYPVLNPDLERSELEPNHDPIMSTGLLGVIWRYYTAHESDRDNPLAAPIRAESLASLPPAMILTAATDPLRFEARAYAAALRIHGTPATVHHYPGVFHGFFGTPHPHADAAMSDVITILHHTFDSERDDNGQPRIQDS